MVRVSPNELVTGDHIYGYRRLHSFSHHGIYVGEGKVIHYTRTDESRPSFDVQRNCKCGFDPNKDHGVVKSCLECFLSGHSLYRVQYGVSSAQRFLKRGGSCSTEASDDTKTVLGRTDSLLTENSFGTYNLLFNNCESFARFCKTGRALSGQVVAAGIVLGVGVAAVGADLAVHEISDDSKNDEDQLSRTNPKLEANKEIHKEDDKGNHEDDDNDDDGDDDEDEDYYEDEEVED